MRLRVWGFLRVSLLVGALSAVYCVNAETVDATPPGDEFEIDTLIRSILRATYDDVWIVSDGDSFWYNVEWATNSLGSAYQSTELILTEIESIQSLLYQSLNSIDQDSDGFAKVTAAIDRLNELHDSVQDARADLDQGMRQFGDALSYVRTEQVLRSASMEVTPGEVSSGSCYCPDYTEVLASIRLILTRVDISVGNIYSQIDSIIQNYLQYWDADFLAFFEDFASALNQGIYRHVNGSTPSDWWHNIAFNLAPVVSNSWSMARLYESWGRTGTIYGDKYHFGDGISSAVWNDIMFPIASLLAPVNDVQVNPLADNPMTEAVRDYYMRGRNNHPTNTIDNPLWVAFTNSVSVDTDALSDAFDDIDLRVKGVFDVGVTNFSDLVDLLEDTVIYVSITNVNNNYLNAEFDFAEGKLDNVSDPQNELPEPQEIDTTHIRSFTGGISGIVEAYGNAFGSVPDDMPVDIMIHQGWTVGGIEVQSIHYNVQGDARFYRWIHNLFSVVWGLILVGVIVSAGVFDFVICFYAMLMCGAMFLGKPAVVLQLARRLVSEFTGFFRSGGD